SPPPEGPRDDRATRPRQALTVRRPADVPAATPLSWLAEKETEYALRLFNNVLPVDRFPDADRGDAGDALALGESIRRDVEYGRGSRVHQALTLGATWSQVAAALDVTPEDARTVLRAYADGQHQLWLGYEKEGVKPFGFDADQHAAALALLDLGDDETAAAVTR
ncbi:hypothetical protein P1P68_02555, partial [Streptomyces scabiei]|uniref:hypothetical protein n=1 Tax=Streptomyces scabiei TaxID=1930 RepID=UPI0029907299